MMGPAENINCPQYQHPYFMLGIEMDQPWSWARHMGEATLHIPSHSWWARVHIVSLIQRWCLWCTWHFFKINCLPPFLFIPYSNRLEHGQGAWKPAVVKLHLRATLRLMRRKVFESVTEPLTHPEPLITSIVLWNRETQHCFVWELHLGVFK